jgi:SAM-dependent methyltransferase
MALGARNVRFETAELDAFDSAEKFDAVRGRLVLCYQPDPISILRRFRNFLKPNASSRAAVFPRGSPPDSRRAAWN